MYELNDTHNPELSSWVGSANESGNDFPIQNLPFAIFRRNHTDEKFRAGVAIGDYIVDMPAALDAGVFDAQLNEIITTLNETSLNAFMSLGSAAWSSVRSALSNALKKGSPAQAKLESVLVAQADAQYKMPAQVGDYTCLLYTSPSPRDLSTSRMPSSA